MPEAALGSSSFITDATGYAVQHLQYLPFGETFVDQQNGYDSRYTFSAKEKDDETQYSYFGARYYDSDLSVWLSVDPMADQRSWVSPYNYCQWNPLNRLDPTGALDEEEPETNIVLVIRNSNEEYQQAKNGNNAGDYDNWHVIVATDIVDGQKQLKEYLGESKADNLIVSCHGYTSGLSLTEGHL